MRYFRDKEFCDLMQREYSKITGTGMSSISTKKNIGKGHNICIPEDKNNNAGVWDGEGEHKVPSE